MRFLLAANILANRRALSLDLSAILFVVNVQPNHTHRAHAPFWLDAAKIFPYKTEALQVEFQSNSNFSGSARRGATHKTGLNPLGPSCP